jgi:hypothetical protein
MAKMMKKSMKGMKKMMKKSMKKGMMKKKAMKVSKVAKSKLAKLVVYRGNKEVTSGGLKKGDLKKNKSGKIVSKKQSDQAKKRFSKTLAPWLAATQKARKQLGIKGFCPIGGKTAKGQQFLKLAKSFFKKK